MNDRQNQALKRHGFLVLVASSMLFVCAAALSQESGVDLVPPHSGGRLTICATDMGASAGLGMVCAATTAPATQPATSPTDPAPATNPASAEPAPQPPPCPCQSDSPTPSRANSRPINYANGEINLVEQDMPSPFPGFGVSRSYNNQMQFSKLAPFGTDWYSTQTPYIVRTKIAYDITVVTGNNIDARTCLLEDDMHVPYLFTCDAIDMSWYFKTYIKDMRTLEVCIVLPPNNALYFKYDTSSAKWICQHDPGKRYILEGNPVSADSTLAAGTTPPVSQFILTVRGGPTAGTYSFGAQPSFQSQDGATPEENSAVTSGCPCDDPAHGTDSLVHLYTVKRYSTTLFDPVSGSSTGAFTKGSPGDQFPVFIKGHQAIPTAWHGDKIESYMDDYGVTTSYTYGDGSDSTTDPKISHIQRATSRPSLTGGSPDAVKDSLIYNYGGGTPPQCTSITHLRQINTDASYAVEQVAYTYDASGFLLTSASRQLPASHSASPTWNTTATSYYKYYDDGTLKYVLRSENYRKYWQDNGTAPEIAGDALKNYADFYFAYDSDREVTREVARGSSGCASCGSGGGGSDPGDNFTRTYRTFSSTDDAENA